MKQFIQTMHPVNGTFFAGIIDPGDSNKGPEMLIKQIADGNWSHAVETKSSFRWMNVNDLRNIHAELGTIIAFMENIRVFDRERAINVIMSYGGAVRERDHLVNLPDQTLEEMEREALEFMTMKDVEGGA